MKKMNTKEMVITSIFVAIILFQSLVPGLGYITFIPGLTSLTIVPVTVLIGVFLLRAPSAFILGIAFGLGSLIAAFTQAKGPFDFAFQNPIVSVLPRVLFAVIAHYLMRAFKQIERLKHGNIMIFGFVSIVTILGIFYGIEAIGNTGGYAQTTKEVLKMISLIASGLFLTMYYMFSIKEEKLGVQVPSAIILSMLMHTILVIGTLAIVNPSVFTETFGDSKSVLASIYTIATTNGLIEAVITVFISTPIIIALNQYKTFNLDPKI